MLTIWQRECTKIAYHCVNLSVCFLPYLTLAISVRIHRLNLGFTRLKSQFRYHRLTVRIIAEVTKPER